MSSAPRCYLLALHSQIDELDIVECFDGQQALTHKSVKKFAEMVCCHGMSRRSKEIQQDEIIQSAWSHIENVQHPEAKRADRFRERSRSPKSYHSLVPWQDSG